jgi:hypothetical protein
VLYLTHFLREIPQISDRLIILDNSEILLNEEYSSLQSGFDNFEVLKCTYQNKEKDIRTQLSPILNKHKQNVFYNLKNINIVFDNINSFKIIINKNYLNDLNEINIQNATRSDNMDISTFYFYLINNQESRLGTTVDNILALASDKVTLLRRIQLFITKKLRKVFLEKSDKNFKPGVFNRIFLFCKNVFCKIFNNIYFILIRKNLFISFQTPRLLTLTLFRLGMPLINYFTFTHTANTSKI